MSEYGGKFDRLFSRWAVLENEHDRFHPDRGLCGGVGACSLMHAAHVLEEEMIDELNTARQSTRFQ